MLADLAPPSIDRIFAQVLTLASGRFTDDHKAAIREGRASLYMVPGRGFAVFGVRGDTLVVLAAAGKRLATRGAAVLLDSLCRSEHCRQIECEVTDLRLARKLTGLGWTLRRVDAHEGHESTFVFLRSMANVSAVE